MPPGNAGDDQASSEADRGDAGAIRLPLGAAVPLSRFLAGRTPLTVAERRLIVEQAIALLTHVYVHLPVKQALYGVDPVGRLRALREHLQAGGRSDDPAGDLAFHAEMTAILSTCRDMHTGYYLPRPFDRSVAFLPFQVEGFHDGTVHEELGRRYVVPRVLLDSPDIAAVADFRRGVEILAWDDDPIDDAVVREGEASPGINAAARHARGVYRLTTRFLAKCPPPERDHVRVTYRTASGAEGRLDVAWRVAALPPGIASLPEGVPIGQAPQALDFETEVFAALKREMTARHLDQTPSAQLLPAPPLPEAAAVASTLPATFEAAARPGPDGTLYGHLRIRSFTVESAPQALAEFARLVALLPEAGLVIDVRDNPGGSIQAAEMMLQALSPRRLARAPLMLRATAFVLQLCQRQPEVYRRWTPSLLRAQRTGLVFSAGVPLWGDDAYADIACCRPGPAPRPVVLIVNALSYSATDFFAAGFQDHGLGRVLGVHGSTGGGGANVRSLQSLVSEIGADRDRFDSLWMPVPLPGGADIHVAFRRSLRTGLYAGLEVEDFGVTADALHRMTARDILEGNVELFAAAVALLRQPGSGCEAERAG